MHIGRLTRQLSYVGEVTGKRQTYYVFRGARHYMVMSLSKSKKNAGNFNIVSAEAVGYVAKRWAGKKGLTSSDVARGSRKPRYVSTALQALNILYILVAEGRARIDARFQTGKQLVFNLA